MTKLSHSSLLQSKVKVCYLAKYKISLEYYIILRLFIIFSVYSNKKIHFGEIFELIESCSSFADKFLEMDEIIRGLKYLYNLFYN